MCISPRSAHQITPRQVFPLCCDRLVSSWAELRADEGWWWNWRGRGRGHSAVLMLVDSAFLPPAGWVCPRLTCFSSEGSSNAPWIVGPFENTFRFEISGRPEVWEGCGFDSQLAHTKELNCGAAPSFGMWPFLRLFSSSLRFFFPSVDWSLLTTGCSPDCQRCSADLQTGVGSICLWCKVAGDWLLGDHCVSSCPPDHYSWHGACFSKDSHALFCPIEFAGNSKWEACRLSFCPLIGSGEGWKSCQVSLQN